MATAFEVTEIHWKCSICGKDYGTAEPNAVDCERDHQSKSCQHEWRYSLGSQSNFFDSPLIYMECKKCKHGESNEIQNSVMERMQPALKLIWDLVQESVKRELSK